MVEGGQTHWQALRVALQLLTTLPTGTGEIPFATKDQSLRWYPLVGFIIGSLLAIALCVVSALPAFLGAVVIVLLWIIVTGGLHLDGVADCADAWVGGFGDRTRTLDIMKDPACGPMGVLALMGIVLLKVAVVYTMLDVERLGAIKQESLAMLVGILVCVPMLARTALLPVFLLLPYVREAGIGSSLGTSLSQGTVLALLLASVLFSCLLLPLKLVLLLCAVLTLVVYLWRVAVFARLGGFTGDCAGALVEGAEALLLLSAAIYLG